MILFPAIDLKDGRCVRLVQGDMTRETVFNDDPAAQARTFQDQGFEWLHVVDLNGAFAGHPVNAEAVEAVLEAVDIPVQLGGGIRDLATIEAWLTKGVRRVVLGTLALRSPETIEAACVEFPGRIAVGIDARGGKVAVEGWAEVSEVEAIDLARLFEGAGVAVIIYTDIDRDGALGGVNTRAVAKLAGAVDIPVIASGGVASLDDLSDLKNCGVRLEGVISGMALYDGRLDAGEALALLCADDA